MLKQLAAVVLLFAATSTAQETRGMILGHVNDATSSAITGAKVIVKNTDTNVSRRALGKASSCPHSTAPPRLPRVRRHQSISGPWRFAPA